MFIHIISISLTPSMILSSISAPLSFVAASSGPNVHSLIVNLDEGEPEPGHHHSVPVYSNGHWVQIGYSKLALHVHMWV